MPQAGTGDTLDTLGDRSMFRNAYRRFTDGHEALVGNMTVESNGVAGVRWYEINNATSGSPSFVQQSTYQPDNTWRWMGSAAMDALGDIAVGFSASSSSINPQIRYAGRLAGDPPNTLAQGEATLFAGTGSQTDTVSRWGDYSDITVDPNDDCTFWYTQEYYASNELVQLEDPDRELQVPELRRRAARHPRRHGNEREQQQPGRRSQGGDVVR